MNKRWLSLSIAVGLVFLLAGRTWLYGLSDGGRCLQSWGLRNCLKEISTVGEPGRCGCSILPGGDVRSGYRGAPGLYRSDEMASGGGGPGRCQCPVQPGDHVRQGQGVPQDYIQPYMWASLAAAQGDEDAVEGLEILGKKMSPDQIAQAQRLAGEWTSKGK